MRLQANLLLKSARGEYARKAGEWQHHSKAEGEGA